MIDAVLKLHVAFSCNILRCSRPYVYCSQPAGRSGIEACLPPSNRLKTIARTHALQSDPSGGPISFQVIYDRLCQNFSPCSFPLARMGCLPPIACPSWLMATPCHVTPHQHSVFTKQLDPAIRLRQLTLGLDQMLYSRGIARSATTTAVSAVPAAIQFCECIECTGSKCGLKGL